MRDRINEKNQSKTMWPETTRLYDADAYMQTCRAKVLAVLEDDGSANSANSANSVRGANSANSANSSNNTGAETAVLHVILDRTVFFPEGGGQSADRGTLRPIPACMSDDVRGQEKDREMSRPGQKECREASRPEQESAPSYRVVDVQQQGGVIIHTVEVRLSEENSDGGKCSGQHETSGFSAALRPGTEVVAQIDFSRRFGFMQNHTGEHIMSGLFHSRYGLDNIGFHLSDNTVTLDVNGHLTDEQIYEVEREANEKVWANIPVQVSYPSAQELQTIPYRSKIEIEGQIRIVTIPGVDICACCAPHVAHTGEIGLIKVVKILRYKGGMRLWILCGQRAYTEMQRRQLQTEAVSHLTNRSQDQIADGVRFLLDEIGGLKQQIRDLEYREAFAMLDEVPAGQKNVYLFVGEMDNLVQRNLVNRLTEEHEGICGVFSREYVCKNDTGKDSDSAGDPVCVFKYILGSRKCDTREVNKILREKFGARGGGKPEMVQGSVRAGMETLREVLP